jgi:hypothetical protein
MIIRYTHLDRHLFIMVLQLILLGSTLAHGAGIIVDHHSVDLSSLLDSDIARAASLSVLMRHASVGQGINWGLDCLAGLHPTNSACSDFPAGKYDRANWLFELRGGNWQEKVNDLVAQTVSRANDFDVFMMKFCYIDALGNNHPDWDYFRSCIEQLEADFPDKRFVWWTIPLTRDGQPGTDVFNAWIRSYCLSIDKILFDIADIECHDPDGTILMNAQGNEVISQNYTKEIHAGHLNIEGRIRVASALWHLMAAIAEDMYEPDALQLLTPNAGERWIAGKTYTISWSYTGSISLVVIEYSIDLGVTWTAVGPPVPSDSGGYDWRVPAVSTNQCLIRVSSAENPNISDTSDEAFMLFIRAAIYVDADATGANNGSSWADALNYLQDALMMASAGDEIRVAQGIYKPDQFVLSKRANLGRMETFQLKNGVVIRGGYAGLGEPDPNARNIEVYETILSGDLSGDDVNVPDPLDLLDEPNRAENSYHVVTSNGTDETSLLDGFTVTGGNADGDWMAPATYKRGAGMDNVSGSPTITNCTFSRNYARVLGGGMANRSESDPTLTNCTFSNNSAGWSGGGMYNSGGNPTLSNCIFSGNVSRDVGGGMLNAQSNTILTYCTFIGNSAEYGGGMFNGNSNPTLTKCTFTENFVRWFSYDTWPSGGGMINDNSHPTLTDCTFSANEALYNSGGMANWDSNPILTNCTFNNNSAHWSGGGMDNYYSSNPVLTNCIFSGNSAGDGGGINNYKSNPTLTNCTFAQNSAQKGNAIRCYSHKAAYPRGVELINCIFWDGGNEIWNSGGSMIDIAYSNIQGGQAAVYDPCELVVWGEGNIDADPLFADPGYWGDVNDPYVVVEPNDPNAVWMDGDYHLKSQAGRWDPTSKSWVQDDVTSPCIDAGNIRSPIGHEPFPNGGIINMGVYGSTSEASKSYFGESVCETIVAGDINGDCKVDFRDFTIMAYHWLGDSNP